MSSKYEDKPTPRPSSSQSGNGTKQPINHRPRKVEVTAPAKNDYIFKDGEQLAELNARYQDLFPKFTAAAAAIKELKAVRTERVEPRGEPRSQEERKRFLEQDQALFVAETKAKMAVLAMHPRLQPLWDACQKAREFDKKNRSEWTLYDDMMILRSNVVVSEAMYNEGCTIHFELGYSGVGSSVSSLFDLQSDEPREWAVMKAAQGSREGFIDSPDRSKPAPPPHMTKREANLDAWNWCEMAKYDGGSATLYNVRTGRMLSGTDPKTFTKSWGDYSALKTPK